METGQGWRVVSYGRAPAAEQLARTEALWRAVAAGESPPTVRWYGYSAPAVVLGVGQSLQAVDGAAVRAAGVQVLKRTSGGTAVLADETMLALDVAVPAGHPHAGADIVAAYRWVGGAFRDALAALAPANAERLRLVSLDAARGDQAAQRGAPSGSLESLRGLACFGTLSPYEVVLDSPAAVPWRKVVGLSQVRKRGVVLYQAGLYATVRAADLADLLALPAPARALLANELARRVAGLDGLGLSAGSLGTLRARIQENLVTA